MARSLNLKTILIYFNCLYMLQHPDICIYVFPECRYLGVAADIDKKRVWSALQCCLITVYDVNMLSKLFCIYMI